VVLKKRAAPAGREAPVVSESPGVRVVPESLVVRVAPENPVVQAGPQPEQKLAVAEQTHVLEAGAPSRHRSPAEAVALTVSAGINPQRAGAAALSAEEAGHLPKRPAIAVAAAWEVGVVVEAEAAEAKKAEADADAKRDEQKNLDQKL
jgi:hypothetical protein